MYKKKQCTTKHNAQETQSAFTYARKKYEMPHYVSLHCTDEMQCSIDMGENPWEKCNEMPFYMHDIMAITCPFKFSPLPLRQPVFTPGIIYKPSICFISDC